VSGASSLIAVRSPPLARIAGGTPREISCSSRETSAKPEEMRDNWRLSSASSAGTEASAARRMHCQGDQVLLGAVVQIAFDASALIAGCQMQTS
jgi:hypothetical protein